MQPKYSLGDRVIVRIFPSDQMPLLSAQGAEFVGKIVEIPGDGLYNVLLDKSPSPVHNMITYMGEGEMRPVDGEAPGDEPN